MNRIKAYGCGTAAAIALLAASAAQATTFPINYQVNVRTNFGTRFTDCFTFDGAGTLTVAGYGTLTYALKKLNTLSSQMGAVAPIASASGVGFEITFTGAINNKTTALYGNDEVGDSYVISGKAVSSCADGVIAPIGSYRHP